MMKHFRESRSDQMRGIKKDEKPDLSLGIDVGGTNTDAVLFDMKQREVISWAKTPTEHTDYSKCIENAMSALSLESVIERIAALNISTTLAVNAVLERQLAPTALILIGYGDFPHIVAEIIETAAPYDVLYCKGGHNSKGAERNPLDADAITAFAARHKGALFAVSSLFSPRNPAHEMAAAAILKSAGCSGVTCGHQISRSHLNSVKRTVTAYLNSALIPVVHDLTTGIRRCRKKFGIKAPVMFLRSDGSLVSESWCASFPLETVFSGPAASMRGAVLLTGQAVLNAVVADIGGTSTDIGRIRSGTPVFSAHGAIVGAYQTMIPSLAVRSAALGGDSKIWLSTRGSIEIGPTRTTPASRGGAGNFTPTDALCILDEARGDKKAAMEAAQKLAGVLGISIGEVAAEVRCIAAEKLKTLFEEAGTSVRRICVGGPSKAFAAGSGASVPPLASVASAVGAASGALELSVSAVISHSFFDGAFRAFLPDRMVEGRDFDTLKKDCCFALKACVRRQAQLMGFSEVRVDFEEECQYVGLGKDSVHITEAVIHAKAVVQNA